MYVSCLGVLCDLFLSELILHFPRPYVVIFCNATLCECAANNMRDCGGKPHHERRKTKRSSHLRKCKIDAPGKSLRPRQDSNPYSDGAKAFAPPCALLARLHPRISSSPVEVKGYSYFDQLYFRQTLPNKS